MVNNADQTKLLSQITPVQRLLKKYGLVNFYNCFSIIFHIDKILTPWVYGSFSPLD